MTGLQRYEITVYAEYSQFYLSDDDVVADTASPEFWTNDALQRRLAVAPPSLIGVGTVTYDNVPISLDVLDVAPTDSLERHQQVVEASIRLASGQLKIGGPLPHTPDDSFRLNLKPGMYRVRIYYAGLQLPGRDHYRLELWQEASYREPRVVVPSN